jgi:uncharacterized protein (DUF433 family)
MEFVMATAAKTAPSSHITKTPEVCGGQPVIDDTRVRVVNIVALLKEGKTPEQMLLAYPSLDLAQVYAALSYYYDHSEEIEATLKEELEWEERQEQLRRKHLTRDPGK